MARQRKEVQIEDDAIVALQEAADKDKRSLKNFMEMILESFANGVKQANQEQEKSIS